MRALAVRQRPARKRVRGVSRVSKSSRPPRRPIISDRRPAVPRAAAATFAHRGVGLPRDRVHRHGDAREIASRIVISGHGERLAVSDARSERTVWARGIGPTTSGTTAARHDPVNGRIQAAGLPRQPQDSGLRRRGAGPWGRRSSGRPAWPVRMCSIISWSAALPSLARRTAGGHVAVADQPAGDDLAVLRARGHRHDALVQVRQDRKDHPPVPERVDVRHAAAP